MGKDLSEGKGKEKEILDIPYGTEAIRDFINEREEKQRVGKYFERLSKEGMDD